MKSKVYFTKEITKESILKMYQVLGKELKGNEILLEVRKSNLKAQNFYTKHGFKEIFVRPKYYKNGEDALILRKELYEDTSN